MFLLVPLIAGCHKKLPANDVPPTAAATTAPKVDPTPSQVIAELESNFQKVYFDYDSATLNAASKTALSANAAILQKYPGIKVQVQGHADERGTTEYNLALGEQRATVVRSYLTTLGVAGPSLDTISFGEEKPAMQGTGETVWSANRRVEFRVEVGAAGIRGTVG